MSGANIINPIIFGGGMNATLLWENHNPTANLGHTVIDVDLSHYNYLLVIGTHSTSGEYLKKISVICDLSTEQMSNQKVKFCLTSAVYGYTAMRFIVLEVQNKGFYFEEGKYIDWQGMHTAANHMCIPTKVFGLKGKINGID